jgi:2-keto-4-pentenoate hydratase/2-oxohepta-3-ene-1,7-dioic acid hydratase in catechol pathway
MYQHVFADGKICTLPVGKIVCVGRNYAAHARELGNEVPEAPILFIKPSSAIVSLQPSFSIPQQQGECHHETEVTILVGSRLKNAGESACFEAIAGIGLGLDLTLRDVQNVLKKKGHPWEVAKAFDGAAPLSPFLSHAGVGNLRDLRFTLQVNEQERQNGHTADMITPILPLMAFISQIFTLEPGDVVMTGTPQGVAALQSGDVLTLSMAGTTWNTAVA